MAQPIADQYDLLILGGGPAGVTAALRASELGARSALIERNRMGGTCTNDGCVPTRALAKAARLMRDAEQFVQYGLVGKAPQVHFPDLMARTQQIVYRIQEKKQLIKHLQAADVDVFSEAGAAHFLDPHTLSTNTGLQFRAERIIVCVDGQARRLSFPGAQHALTHSDVWSLKALPASVAIIGAAATGCQLASIFADFGVRVSLLDLAPKILPAEDAHVSQVVAEAFLERGIEVLTPIDGIDSIEALSPGRPEQAYHLHFRQDGKSRQREVGAVILAVGWPGNLDALNLPAAGLVSERGYIPVNEHLQTNVAHVFAAGDITGRMMLVQSAGYEARIAAENAVRGPTQEYGHYIVPHGGFTDPEYGSVGLTERQARAGDDVAVSLIPYAQLDRACIDGHTTGFCKLIASRSTRQILGAHVVGEQAVEVVQLVAAGMAAGIRVDELAGLELAYPTYTAIVGLAARRLAHDCDLLPLAPQWRALHRLPGSEWEMADS